ncbi:MAG: O-GlcNAc transferase, partial [Verrucomicrobia bacterium]|nr:O-GlcNAc transferase [Verrucomicrobiota bacterium]
MTEAEQEVRHGKRQLFSREVRFVLAVSLLIVTAVGSVYSPLKGGGFIWDDDSYVTQNRALFGKAGLKKIWIEPGATPQYYPLTFTSFWIERRLFGFNPNIFHLDNILLHGFNAVLLFLILRRLKIPGAALAGVIFAIHPVHDESVAWVTERKNVLSGLFYFVSLLAWIRYAGWDDEEGRGERSRIYYL